MMSKVCWVTEPNGYLEPQLDASGFGSVIPKTVIELFQETVKKHGHRNAIGYKLKKSNKSVGDWRFWTYKDYWAQCMRFAKSLVFLKIESFKIVNILGFNSPEWFFACLGSVLAGCIGTGIYITNTPAACRYISEHSKAEVVVLEGNHQLEKYCGFTRDDLPNLKVLVVYGEAIERNLAAKCAFPVYPWDEFMGLGEKVSESDVDLRGAKIKPGNCATLIYTSGTMGSAKAVMISHDNLTWTARNILENYTDFNHTERIVSYLPLSHVAGQLIDMYLSMGLGACAYFAEPDALKGTLTNTLKEVRPTLFFGVPRVWEKIEEKMVQMGRANSGLKRALSQWAKGLGAERCRRLQYGNDRSVPACYSCAHALVLSKVKQALGLDQAKMCITAAAPIALGTMQYFASLGIPIYEVFGQSECLGPHTFSTANAWKIGTCGRPMKGTVTKIAEGSGELCYRGRHIFMGYMYMPEQTAETFDEEGFLRSGDIAVLDDDADPDLNLSRGPGLDLGPGLLRGGFLRVTGRIKELLITAGGENIPPALIEGEVKKALPGALSNCLVIGDKRKYLTMLVSLKVNVDAAGNLLDSLAPDCLHVGAQIGSSATTYSAAKADPLWRAHVDAGVRAANQQSVSRAQLVQKWDWLPADFTEKAGELTPTLKLKRSVVYAKYAALIDALYASGDN
jgi:long-chain-fatty-acid--CoA ligase ACSBG